MKVKGLFYNKIMTTVYALTNPSFPEIKIGFSSNIQQRLGVLNSSVPNRFSVYFSRTYPNVTIARQVESRVHERFREYRASNGEFFHIDPEEAALELYHIGNDVMSKNNLSDS
jgi:hypothetical protein